MTWLTLSQGASPADILHFVDAFYAKYQSDVADAKNVDDQQFSTQTVDRRFQEKVWSWLTRHPEVSVGRDRQGNHLSLADAERIIATSKEGSEASKPLKDTSAKSSKRSASDSAFQPNVFVSQERTWLAIAGHEPDDTRVRPTEYVLLSIIASRKGRGILQPELVALSGQDKRSVPKRTDALAARGYIDKRPINVARMRTSICTLQRFVQGSDQDGSAEGEVVESSGGGGSRAKVFDVKPFVDKLFGILREHKIISRNDLKRLLRFEDLWRFRILSRAVRKFERIGVLKRVKAKSQYTDMTKKLHSCVMLVREPSQRDAEMFFEYGLNLESNLAAGDEGNVNEYRDDDEEDAEAGRAAKEPSSDDINPAGSDGRELFEESGRILPTWTPDRHIFNLIFEAVDKSGTEGKSNRVRRILVGLQQHS